MEVEYHCSPHKPEESFLTRKVSLPQADWEIKNPWKYQTGCLLTKLLSLEKFEVYTDYVGTHACSFGWIWRQNGFTVCIWGLSEGWGGCFDLLHHNNLHMLSSCSQPGSEDIGHPQNQVLIEAQFRQDPKSPASNFVLGHILLCTDLWLKYKKLNNTWRK